MELVMEQEAPAGEVCLTPEAMDAYLDTLRQQGRSADTLAAYRRSIYGLVSRRKRGIQQVAGKQDI